MGTDDPPMDRHTTLEFTTVAATDTTSAEYSHGNETRDDVDSVVVTE